MTKAQAAETLKKFISPNMKAKDYTSDSLKEAVTKAIEVLSDKTEYVKRSTYRKLKEENIRLEWLVINKSDELDTMTCTYEQLVADASELKMEKEMLQSDNKKLSTTVVTLAIITILTIAVTFAIYA